MVNPIPPLSGFFFIHLGFGTKCLLLNAKWAIFQIYNGMNKLYFEEMIVMSALYLAWLGIYNASSPNQQFNGRQVSPLGHIIMIPSQPRLRLRSFILGV